MRKPDNWPVELMISRPWADGSYGVSTMMNGQPVLVAMVSRVQGTNGWGWEGRSVLADVLPGSFTPTLRTALAKVRRAWRRYQETAGSRTLLAIDYHRNGVCGKGFHVILFRDRDGSRKVATWFGSVDPDASFKEVHDMSIAVLDVDLAAAGNIAMSGGNAWRGDHYLEDVRRWVRWWDGLAPDQFHLAARGELKDLPPIPEGDSP
jgi:hypothetical protein